MSTKTNLVLCCYGCAHSASGEDRPAGERPCGFCTRRGGRSVFTSGFIPEWYDGSKPIKIPMDNYITVDRLDQQAIFDQDWDILCQNVKKAKQCELCPKKFKCMTEER